MYLNGSMATYYILSEEIYILEFQWGLLGLCLVRFRNILTKLFFLFLTPTWSMFSLAQKWPTLKVTLLEKEELRLQIVFRDALVELENNIQYKCKTALYNISRYCVPMPMQVETSLVFTWERQWGLFKLHVASATTQWTSGIFDPVTQGLRMNCVPVPNQQWLPMLGSEPAPINIRSLSSPVLSSVQSSALWIDD